MQHSVTLDKAALKVTPATFATGAYRSFWLLCPRPCAVAATVGDSLFYLSCRMGHGSCCSALCYLLHEPFQA
jgi:hypothetical protein